LADIGAKVIVSFAAKKLVDGRLQNSLKTDGFEQRIAAMLVMKKSEKIIEANCKHMGGIEYW